MTDYQEFINKLEKEKKVFEIRHAKRIDRKIISFRDEDSNCTWISVFNKNGKLVDSRFIK